MSCTILVLVADAWVAPPDAMGPKQEDLSFELPEWPGVKCLAQRGDLVTIGIEGTGPGGQRLTVKKRNGERAEAAALRKLNQHASSSSTGSSRGQGRLSNV